MLLNLNNQKSWFETSDCWMPLELENLCHMMQTVKRSFILNEMSVCLALLELRFCNIEYVRLQEKSDCTISKRKTVEDRSLRKSGGVENTG